MLRTAFHIIRDEGILAIYQGLPAALLRHIVYTGIRLNIYEQIRELFGAGKNAQNNTGLLAILKKAVAGAVAGAISQIVASPTDLVKVRMQAQGKLPIELRYRGTLHAFTSIYRSEGLLGMWKGVVPNAQRAALVNLGELATYDTGKRFLLNTGKFQDNVICHTASSVISGFVGTLCSCPADVVKTRMMSQRDGSSSAVLYKSSLDCLVKTVRAEGFLALYKGFLPTWMRLGPWQLYFWITYEQLRKFSGMESF